MLLFREDIVETRVIHSPEADVSIDAADHQTDSPVPARMTLHFSDQIHVRDAVVSVDSQVKRLFERLFRGFGNRRDEKDVQTVPSRFQQLLHVDSEPPEHVARGRGLLPVDKDVGKGVKRVDVQVDGLFAQKFGGNGKLL